VVARQRLFDVFFFFQAEDGIRDWSVTGVQTCALPIFNPGRELARVAREKAWPVLRFNSRGRPGALVLARNAATIYGAGAVTLTEIGRASCRERGERSGGAGSLEKKKNNVSR